MSRPVRTSTSTPCRPPPHPRRRRAHRISVRVELGGSRRFSGGDGRRRETAGVSGAGRAAAEKRAEKRRIGVLGNGEEQGDGPKPCGGGAVEPSTARPRSVAREQDCRRRAPPARTPLRLRGRGRGHGSDNLVGATGRARRSAAIPDGPPSVLACASWPAPRVGCQTTMLEGVRDIQPAHPTSATVLDTGF